MTTDDTPDRGVRYGIGGKVVAAHMDGDVRVIDQIDLQEVSMTTDDTRPPDCLNCGAPIIDSMAGCCHDCGAEDRWIGSQWLSMPSDMLPLDAERARHAALVEALNRIVELVRGDGGFIDIEAVAHAALDGEPR